MGRPSKYPDELRERAVRMVAEVRPQYPSQWAAITAVTGDAGGRDGGDAADLDPPWGGRRRSAPGGDLGAGCGEQAAAQGHRRVASRERDLEGSSDFLRAGLRWGVEPMCEALSKVGIAISTSAYYEWIAKQPTRRQLRDAELVEIITAQRADKKTGKFVATLGRASCGSGCAARVMTSRAALWSGSWVSRAGRAPATAPSTRPRSKTRPTRFPDRVDRNFRCTLAEPAVGRRLRAPRGAGGPSGGGRPRRLRRRGGVVQLRAACSPGTGVRVEAALTTTGRASTARWPGSGLQDGKDRILTRAGAVVPEPAKRPRSSYIRFEASQPNETWQSDFTHYRLANRTDTEIITWLDDHSRYALHISAHHRVTAKIVAETFIQTASETYFGFHGRPGSSEVV